MPTLVVQFFFLFASCVCTNGFPRQTRVVMGCSHNVCEDSNRTCRRLNESWGGANCFTYKCIADRGMPKIVSSKGCRDLEGNCHGLNESWAYNCATYKCISDPVNGIQIIVINRKCPHYSGNGICFEINSTFTLLTDLNDTRTCKCELQESRDTTTITCRSDQ